MGLQETHQNSCCSAKTIVSGSGKVHTEEPSVPDFYDSAPDHGTSSNNRQDDFYDSAPDHATSSNNRQDDSHLGLPGTDSCVLPLVNKLSTPLSSTQTPVPTKLTQSFVDPSPLPSMRKRQLRGAARQANRMDMFQERLARMKADEEDESADKEHVSAPQSPARSSTSPARSSTYSPTENRETLQSSDIHIPSSKTSCPERSACSASSPEGSAEASSFDMVMSSADMGFSDELELWVETKISPGWCIESTHAEELNDSDWRSSCQTSTLYRSWDDFEALMQTDLHGMSISEAFSLLGVSENATCTQISSAFRHCSRSCHPDKVGSSSEEFQQLAVAYHVALNSKS